MNDQEIKDEWPHLGPNDPPIDWSREEAAFERVRAGLFRDYPGQFVILRFDEVVGPFPTYEEAVTEAYRRFGFKRWCCRDITEKDEPDFVSYVDINHPSIKRLD
jgi:hypothetical protein